MSQLLFLGAEAELRRDEFLGRPAVTKRRIPKTYRHPELDGRLRRERTRTEAQLLAEARAAGVPVPALLDVDVSGATLWLEWIPGPRLRDALEETRDAASLSRRFGELVGRLHAANLAHGDLTTSNVHVDGDRLVLLDFGLAERARDVEELGVDLHLVERTYEASHPGRAELFAAFLEGYRAAFPRAAAVVRRMQDIKARARYA